MATPMSVLFLKRSNAEMLTYLQGYFPNVTAVTLNLDGSILIQSSDTIEGSESDIMQILSSENVWKFSTL